MPFHYSERAGSAQAEPTPFDALAMIVSVVGDSMEVFDWLRETFRSHARDDICAGLQRLGIDARMAERGRPQESTISGRGSSLGVLDVDKGPIRWVNVQRENVTSALGWFLALFSLFVRTDSTREDTDVYYWTEYGVPDERLLPQYQGLRIKSRRLRKFRLFGPVVDVRWEGPQSGPDVGAHLGGDSSLKSRLGRVESDIEIKAFPDDKCWVLSTVRKNVPSEELAPSRELWNCLQTVIEHLPIEPPPPLLFIVPQRVSLEEHQDMIPEGATLHDIVGRLNSETTFRGLERWIGERPDVLLAPPILRSVTLGAHKLLCPWVALASRRLVAGVYRQSLWDRVAMRAEACEVVLNVRYDDIDAVSAYLVGRTPRESPELTRISTGRGILDIELDLSYSSRYVNGLTLAMYIQQRVEST